MGIVLEKMWNSPIVRAWKLCTSCCLLPRVGIDLLLDTCVVDWNELYLSCLESISKHCGTNLKNVCERSYDKINKLKSLSDWLTKDRPGLLLGNPIWKRTSSKNASRCSYLNFGNTLTTIYTKVLPSFQLVWRICCLVLGFLQIIIMIRPCIILSVLCWIWLEELKLKKWESAFWRCRKSEWTLFQ